MSIRITLSALLTVVSLTSQSLAAIDVVHRKPGDFVNYPMASSQTVRVAGVRVIAADYELIARDFPQQRRAQGESTEQWKERIDRWLIKETGFIAREQTKQTTVNTQIPVIEDYKSTYRPTGYNRAHLIPVEDGMMDAKGVGSHKPEQRHHGNGLATLGEMIREYVYEKAVEMVFEHSGIKAKTVGSYAVLDYGFDVIHEDGSRSRAGYILRQNHQRSKGFNSSAGPMEAFRIEKTLRAYGLTTSGETFAMREAGVQTPNNFWDYTNVQSTNNDKIIEVVDFGAFLAVEKFEHRLVSNAARDFILLHPKQGDFVQPDLKLRLPLEMWGTFGKQDPKSDKPFVWSHELARALAEGRADRSAVDTHLKNFLDPIEKKIGGPRSCRRMFMAM